MKKHPQHGHRRTGSDHLASYSADMKLKIKFDELFNDVPQVIKCIQDSSNKNKTKTVCVEPLEVPKEESNMFIFGKNKQNNMSTNSCYEHLSKIPENTEKKQRKISNKNRQDQSCSKKKKSNKRIQHKTWKSHIFEDPQKKDHKASKQVFHEYHIKREESKSQKDKPQTTKKKKANMFASIHYFNIGPGVEELIGKNQERSHKQPIQNHLSEEIQNLNFKASIYGHIQEDNKDHQRRENDLDFISETVIITPTGKKKCKNTKNTVKCKNRKKQTSKRKSEKSDKKTYRQKRNYQHNEKPIKQPSKASKIKNPKKHRKIKSFDLISEVRAKTKEQY